MTYACVGGSFTLECLCQWKPKALNAPRPGVTDSSELLWVLGTELGSSARTVCVLLTAEPSL